MAGTTTNLVAGARKGDSSARSALIEHSCARLRLLTRKMLKDYPHVGRWEQTDDVLQNALLRLCRAIEDGPLESSCHFYHLAALQIRRELLDLTDRYQGPNGLATNHHTDPTDGVVAAKSEQADGPSSLAEWAEFHSLVNRLPPEEREVFGLIWYQGLTQKVAAKLLGVCERTLKRRWQAARLAFAQLCDNEAPG